MTKQIAVRLPEELVDHMDALIESGDAPSRAALVTSALEREFRRRLSENDVKILMALQASGEKDEFDEMAAWAARRPRGLD